MEEQSGVINVDKPSGMTSREVVDLVEEHLPGAKLGHGGTLDRLATGVLPILVNEATKLVPYLHRQSKTYRVTARFDCRSETLDRDGTVEEVPVDRSPSSSTIRDLLEQFTGEIEQVPPKYSALKKDGRRLAEWVENGEEVDPDPRMVKVDEMTLLDNQFPELVFEVTCGKGFYVRSLVRDLGYEWDLEGGIVTELRRIRYGPFDHNEAVPPERTGLEEAWHPPVDVVEPFYRVECDEARLTDIRHGTYIKRDRPDVGPGYAVDDEGRLHALMRPVERNGILLWHPNRVLNRTSRDSPVGER